MVILYERCVLQSTVYITLEHFTKYVTHIKENNNLKTVIVKGWFLRKT